MRDTAERCHERENGTEGGLFPMPGDLQANALLWATIGCVFGAVDQMMTDAAQMLRGTERR